MSSKNKTIMGRNGFLKLQRAGAEHVTLWVEGRDGIEPSVSGIALDKESLIRLRERIDGILRQWPK